MAGLGEIPLDEVVHFDVVTHNVSTGAVSDADSTPTFDVFEEATDTPIVSATNFTKRTSLTGNYRGTFTASAANGFEVGKWYNIVASATVNSVAAKTIAHSFRIIPAESSAGVQKVDLTHIGGSAVSTSSAQLGVNIVNAAGTAWASGAITSGVFAAGSITASAIATDAIDADALATDAIAEINATVDTALQDIHLDHLIQSADPGSIVANNSLWAKLHASGDTADYTDYDHTADSLMEIKSKTLNIEVDTQDIQSRIGTPTNLASGATLANNLQDIEAQTDDIGTAGLGLTAVPWNSAWAAQVRSAVGLASADLDTQLAALPTANENADAVLSRGVSNVQDTADTTSLCTVVLAMLESSISGTTWTIRKTGGTTFVSKTLTTTATADAVTGVT